MLTCQQGSGSANFPYLVTPDTAIQNTVLAAGGAYESSLDNGALTVMGALARRANVSIIFANADSGETYIEVDSTYTNPHNSIRDNWRQLQWLRTAV